MYFAHLFDCPDSYYGARHSLNKLRSRPYKAKCRAILKIAFIFQCTFERNSIVSVLDMVNKTLLANFDN